MKSLGIVRKVDELGRIVLPIEVRRKFDIEEKDSLEIYTDNDCIVLKKYEPSCIFCGNSEEVFDFNGKILCSECAEKIKVLIEEE